MYINSWEFICLESSSQVLKLVTILTCDCGTCCNSKLGVVVGDIKTGLPVLIVPFGNNLFHVKFITVILGNGKSW